MKKWLKRFALINLMLILGISLESEQLIYQHQSEFEIPVLRINEKSKEEDLLLKAIMYVESNYDVKIVNHKEDAVGILQIRPIAVREVNRILTLQQESDYRFSLDDRIDSLKSVQMWYIIQEYHNPEYDPMLAARIWNGGSKQYKPMSHQYWLKVKKQY